MPATSSVAKIAASLVGCTLTPALSSATLSARLHTRWSGACSVLPFTVSVAASGALLFASNAAATRAIAACSCVLRYDHDQR